MAQRQQTFSELSHTFTRSVACAGVVAASLLVLAGCSATRGAPATSNAPMSPPPPIANTPGLKAVPQDDLVTADEEAAADATNVASKVVAVFCRPSVGYDAWIAELYPLLSETAGSVYETVDPANVPCTTVIGAGVPRPGDDPFTVGVVVPTDVGEYLVYVHRVDADAPWAVEQISPVSAE